MTRHKLLLFFLFLIASWLLVIPLGACVGGKKSERSDLNQSLSADKLTEVILPSGTPSQMVVYPGFKVSFNSVWHQPNYVAWELTAAETEGKIKRTNNFRTDPDVAGCPLPEDYRYSGYDRGHMAPAADFKWSDDAMSATHFLTNICPQDNELNRGAWNTVENNCRKWAQRDSAIIIICGPVTSRPALAHIGISGVPVPSKFFKVVLAPFANPPRAIGFLMDNAKVPGGAQTAVVTVDSVESITGMDFFSSLPDEVEAEVEGEAHYQQWQRKASKR